MACSRVDHAQLQAFSDCLHQIYDSPTGDNPVHSILEALDQLIRIDSIAADELLKDPRTGRHLKQTHVGARRAEILPDPKKIVPQIAHDHPLIQHVLRHGDQPTLKMSDFLSERQLRNISIYHFNNRLHRWRDQVAVMSRVSGGTLSIALNRDRTFTNEEYLLLQLLQPHLRRVINRCALFKLLPGNEQLTPREREVLYWMTQGKRDDEIAAIIRAKPRTINKHVHTILTKLNVENRASAVAAVLSGK